MLRNNVSEWNEKLLGPFDFSTNRKNVIDYWSQRVIENGKFENVYTLGMRGIHDSAMQGGGTLADKVARLDDVLSEQRAMLRKHVNADLSKVPQAFVPYKEVLPLYQGGLNVPDDVTLVWPDDNFGYIRRLSTPEEQRRAGGAGVYYHLSYWGIPEDFLWLDSTPPALVREEMNRAYAYGARNIWIVNVGDIKPIESGTDFFLRLAWNPNRFDANCQLAFLTTWAAENFGARYADEIAAIMDEYYRLNLQARPEHTPYASFSWDNYGEAQTRLDRFARLMTRVDALYGTLPNELRDAGFELLVYPVHGAALMSEKQLCAARARELQAKHLPAAEVFAERAKAAQSRIDEDTRYYNDQLAGSKWKHVISDRQRGELAFRPVDMGPATQPSTPTTAPSLPIATTSVPADFEGFIDQDGIISMEAEHPTRSNRAGDATWTVLPGLGRSGDAITVAPPTMPKASISEIFSAEQLSAASPSLQYDFFAVRSGPTTVEAYCLPTHAVNDRSKLRYAVAIDDERPRMVNIDSPEFSTKWKANVLANAAIGRTLHDIKAGKHTLTIWAVDPAIVLDKIVLDLGGLKHSFLGPPETPARRR